MTDEEMIVTVAVLAGAYYVFVVRPRRLRNPRTLQGQRGSARGTVGGGASKAPGTWHNTNPATNAQQRGDSRPHRSMRSDPARRRRPRMSAHRRTSGAVFAALRRPA